MIRPPVTYGMPWVSILLILGLTILSTLGFEWFVGSFMFVLSYMIISSGSNPWYGGKL